jgi:hypothetical protein
VDPTVEVADAWNAIGEVMAWAGFPVDAANVNNTSFLNLLGMAVTDNPAALALIAEADWDALMANWVVPNVDGTAFAPPAVFQLAKGGLVGRAIRIKYGMQLRASAIAANAAASLATASNIVLGGVPPGGGLASAVSSSRKVKLSQVVDQATEEEVQLLDDAAISAAYNRYDITMGGVPPEGSEPSLEQLTAVFYLVFIAKVIPWIDFAVFGPNAIRMLRKLRLTGLILSPSGQLIHGEMSGPALYEQWEACAEVAKVAFIMLGVMQPSGFDVYRDHIKQYSNRYGTICWPLVYQADTRARRELAERVRRRLEREGKLVVGGIPVAMPWDVVYRQLPLEFAFWRREVEDPAILILTRGSGAGARAAVQGDAPVAERPGDHIAHTDAVADVRSSSDGNRTTPNAKKAKTKVRGAGAATSAGGLFTSNRRGNGLCPDWQLGTCANPCPHNLQHQCSSCLDNLHGLSTHGQVPKGGGKGKKGKDGGKGAKGK